jgi:hypothetical protein
MVIFTKEWPFYSGQNEPLSSIAMQGIAVSPEQGVATPCSIYHGVTINMSH